MQFPNHHKCVVAVIGLGYIGLPISLEFAKERNCLRTSRPLQRKVIAFDINEIRVGNLKKGIDTTNETTTEEINSCNSINFTNKAKDINNSDVFIIAVPTPIDSSKRPDFSFLKKASETVGKALKERNSNSSSLPIVIYESTVYPGATEEICLPILEEESNLILNKDFFLGYSPERINPGDKTRRMPDIVKLTSGSTHECAIWIDNFYGSIIKAGTHMTENIKVAEAAKVIENTQRDLNIALINELAIILRKIGLDTNDVLKAAGTKWNFLPFRPGLVGGHCIGVDPYYLTHKSEELGYIPEIVLAGRRINDSMSQWLVEQLILEMTKEGITIGGAKVLVLGFSYKENCPDLRNTKVLDLIKLLEEYRIDVTVVDPLVDPIEAKRLYSINLEKSIPLDRDFSGIIMAVAHKDFCNIDKKNWSLLKGDKTVLLDLKGIIPRELNPLRL